MIPGGVENLDPQTVKDDLIERMLELYAPDDELIEVVLPDGELLKFRSFRDYSEQKQFERKAVEWFRSLPRPATEEAKAHPFGESLPSDATAALSAFTISELSVEPKIGQLGALRLLKASGLVTYILKSIDLGNKTIGSLFEQRLLEAAKNASGATAGGEQNSPSPETPSESTPTA